MTWPQGKVTCHYCGSTYLGLNKIELMNDAGHTVPFNVYFFPFTLGNYLHRSAGYRIKRFTIYCSSCQRFFTVDEAWETGAEEKKDTTESARALKTCKNPQGCPSDAIQELGKERFSINITTKKIYPQWTERLGGGLFGMILLISILLSVLLQSYFWGIVIFICLLALALLLSISIINMLGVRTVLRHQYRCTLCGYTWYHFIVYNLFGGLKPENIFKEWWEQSS